MIAARLMGGLGNQLFQYAAGRRLALRHGVELTLDLGWFRHEAPHVTSPRAFELDRFPLSFRTVEIDPSRIARWEGGSRRLIPGRRLTVLRQDGRNAAVDRRVLDAPDGVVLVGYWQSEAYFADVRELIRGELAPTVIGGPGKTAPAGSTDEPVVAVHVRRGDYVSDAQTNAFHGALPRDYYARAVAHVAERIGSARFVAFSDDPDWVEQELAAELPLTVVRGADALDELGLMALCEHFVLANSSFSWWGAWLGERDGSMVVAPRQWFADPAIDTSAVIPERWTRL